MSSETRKNALQTPNRHVKCARQVRVGSEIVKGAKWRVEKMCSAC